MYKQGFVIFLIFISVIACKTSKETLEPKTKLRPYLFPVEWIGHYKGDLYLLGTDNDTLTVDMELIIDSPDGMGLYPWVLKYNDKDVRYYGIEVIDAAKGHYLIDEHNSIKIDGFLRSNHFVSRFAVMGSDLIFHYEKQADGIAIQVHASGSEPFSQTGGEIINQDTVPSVNSFRMAGYQTGFLKQIK